MMGYDSYLYSCLTVKRYRMGHQGTKEQGEGKQRGKIKHNGDELNVKMERKEGKLSNENEGKRRNPRYERLKIKVKN